MLIVAHGMGEHAGRYLAPLAPIIRRGVDVAAIDHRGHGEDALAAASLGDYGEGGFAGVEADLIALVDTREPAFRSEEHTSELQSLMRIPYAVFCLTKTTSIPHSAPYIHSALRNKKRQKTPTASTCTDTKYHD